MFGSRLPNAESEFNARFDRDYQTASVCKCPERIGITWTGFEDAWQVVEWGEPQATAADENPVGQFKKLWYPSGRILHCTG
ncbi:MAG: hypothetical protein JWM11_5248 [Planctomycetaceae bacterium]|nr:hypothetical protein [Planctomycetaceae bacterium]